MFDKVKIGEQDVPMLAMASVDHYYQCVFHADPIKLQADAAAMAEGGSVHFLCRMAFIMAKFAELHDRKAMLQLSEDAYFEWLDGFKRGELLDALPAIRALYDGEKLPSVGAKKNNGEQSES